MARSIAKALARLLPPRSHLNSVQFVGRGRQYWNWGVPVAIAVPAKDECRRIATLLACLGDAIAAQDLRSCLAVVVNNTTDDTVARAGAACLDAGIDAIILDVVFARRWAHAGTARGVAMDLGALLAAQNGAILSTDADTRPDRHWIDANLAELARGAELVCGRIDIDPGDAARFPEPVRAAAAAVDAYFDLMRRIESVIDPDPWNPWPHHGAVGGASLGVSAAAYRDLGGLPRRPVSEDRALLDRFRAHDRAVVHSDLARVVVSGRTHGRAPGGMADAVAARLADPDCPIDARAEPAYHWLRRLHYRAHTRRRFIRGMDLRPVCDDLRIAPRAAALIARARHFGTAWQAIEAASFLSERRSLRPSQLPLEMARLNRYLNRASTAPGMAGAERSQGLL